MDAYTTLGRTGLKVSRLALGTMTFGWGADKTTAKALFDRYRDAGGNFVDTADLYAGGTSEEWLGECMRESKSRTDLVVSTKFSFAAKRGNPNAGGNGRKNILRALEGSLKRLQTDYVDLYFVHVWDGVTPVEEVMATLNALVESGKVLHIGLSDVPAWYAARAQTLAELRGYEPIAALQLEYSLVSRNLEREHLGLAQTTGISLMPWSPLGSGFLSGKYRRVDGKMMGQGRVIDTKDSGNPVLEKFAKREKNWEVLEALFKVAQELGRSPAEVALAWVVARPQVASTLVGATKLEQLDKNLAALEVTLSCEQVQALDQASALEPSELDHFFGPTMQAEVHGGVRVQKGW